MSQGFSEKSVKTLKTRLKDAPECVLNDVLDRCDPETHGELIDWIFTRSDAPAPGRLPRAWSPKKNKKVWILYAAADLNRPEHPPV